MAPTPELHRRSSEATEAPYGSSTPDARDHMSIPIDGEMPVNDGAPPGYVRQGNYYAPDPASTTASLPRHERSATDAAPPDYLKQENSYVPVLASAPQGPTSTSEQPGPDQSRVVRDPTYEPRRPNPIIAHSSVSEQELKNLARELASRRHSERQREQLVMKNVHRALEHHLREYEMSRIAIRIDIEDYKGSRRVCVTCFDVATDTAREIKSILFRYQKSLWGLPFVVRRGKGLPPLDPTAPGKRAGGE